MCSRPFRPLGVPIYVARVPAAPFASKHVRERAAISNLGSDGVTSLLASGKPSTKKQERTLDRHEENRCGDVDAEFDANKSERRRRPDVVICAELAERVNSEFLNQVGAVGDARDESCARNCDSPK